MEWHKVFLIFFAIILVQTTYCKPRDYSSAEIEWAKNVVNINPSASEKLLIFVVDNLMTIPKKYAANAVNTTRYLLKDEALEDISETEMREFKEKLNIVLHEYDPSARKMKSYYKTMDHFVNMVDYYYGHHEPKYSIIVSLLDKYDCKNVAMKLNDHLDIFFVEFMKMFRERKHDMSEPLLDWYDRFITLTDMQEKMKSIIEFVDLA
ncbi:uncharacterized protein LOC119614646 [Lucilia sericata]|uniref:uncharacterized protein LOC119614646 n=1 Tax=Lucilia sericata TaxID=13632 RepID=UPI0018A856D7|nr:uncharacterized protein LOC119614646 [Lucilia sericata]